MKEIACGFAVMHFTYTGYQLYWSNEKENTVKIYISFQI